jgi:transposase
MQITTVGLDLAKRIFQVHAVDASGSVVVRKALRRSQVLPFFTKLPSCLIGMEACGTSSTPVRAAAMSVVACAPRLVGVCKAAALRVRSNVSFMGTLLDPGQTNAAGLSID